MHNCGLIYLANPRNPGLEALAGKEIMHIKHYTPIVKEMVLVQLLLTKPHLLTLLLGELYVSKEVSTGMTAKELVMVHPLDVPLEARVKLVMTDNPSHHLSQYRHMETVGLLVTDRLVVKVRTHECRGVRE